MTSAKPFLRKHEVLAAILKDESAGLLCGWPYTRGAPACRKPLVTGLFHWSDDAPFTVTVGWGGPVKNSTQRFEDIRHADGTTHSTDGSTLVGSHPLARCGKCRAYESFEVKQQAYGDQVTCSACGDSNYYSIGD